MIGKINPYSRCPINDASRFGFASSWRRNRSLLSRLRSRLESWAGVGSANKEQQDREESITVGNAASDPQVGPFSAKMDVIAKSASRDEAISCG